MNARVAGIRSWLHGLLAPSEGQTVIDLGCGCGDDLRQFADEWSGVRFIGVDRSNDWLARAHKSSADAGVDYVCADASRGLPFGDGSVDAIYSVNLLECLADRGGAIRECARVLRPGGRIVMAHYDWDTQTFDGEDRAQVRRIVQAYSDWQQAWMPAIDPWCGRRLWGLFQDEGSFVGDMVARTLIETEFDVDSYGRRMAESFESLVVRGRISEPDYASFMAHLQRSAESGTFFYSVTMYAFVGARNDTRSGNQVARPRAS